MDEQNRRNDFIERYENESIPWDDELPPPELISFVEEVEPGVALDLGCGYGRSSIYLARHGWQVDGIDFVPKAIAIAQERANEVGVGEDVKFYVASVIDLNFLNGPYDFALDIGCMHSLTEAQLLSYRNGLARLLEGGGSYLLFVHLRDETVDDEDERRWITLDFLLNLFSRSFELVDMELGVTQVEDKPPWKSGWFHFKRIKGHER